jgi:hypothetical protein
MKDKRQPKEHDMRLKGNKEKMYGTVAQRNAVHGIQSKPVKQDVKDNGKKEGENG